MSDYSAEMAFLDRKLPITRVKWDVMASMGQLLSPPMADAEASSLITKLRDAIGKKAGVSFPKMIFPVTSKLRGGTRVVVVVNLLREIFADEIEDSSGGGGRGYNPMSNQPRPPGSRGV